MHHVSLSLRLIAIITLLVAAGSTAASAGDSRRSLTGPPVRYTSVQGTDYRLVPAHPRDAAGKPVGLPATRINIQDQEGEWEVARDADLPAFTASIPPALRDQVQLFYASATGWLVMPRGWHVQRTAVGADGNTIFSFVAPEGAHAGWLSWELYPACLGCIYEAAQGLFPGAHKQLDTLMETSTPEPALDPTPEKLERLDRCTVRLTYALPKSPAVRSLSVFDQSGDPVYRELSIALPASQSALADYLLSSYKDEYGGCGKT
ncbi:DUF4850 domain-containing protein [Dyella subtropica]|uniref:DUF4850 domain-containing protein n=1 Tax=Dyella subtropica TaxID=2992127 RepID=UPI002253C85E|nr:DUF4850 domain-containing protein [Dyella subtropica]